MTLSTFIPKPDTPFQWEAQDDKDRIQDKISFLMDRLRPLRGVRASYRDPAYSEIEGIISRGDRRIGRLIYNAWKRGAKFDSWGDHFNYQLWLDALEEAGLEGDFYLRERQVDEILPWDHIDNRLLKKFLKRERRNAYQEATVIDCRDGCLACGVCDFETLTMRIVKDGNVDSRTMLDPEDQALIQQAEQRIAAPPTSYELPETIYTARLRYEKSGMSSYLGHLDVQRAFLRAISLSGLGVVFSQGFNKKPRIASGPALPLGYTSATEFMDILLSKAETGVRDRLNHHLPEGLQILEANVLAGRLPALSASIQAMTHLIRLDDAVDMKMLEQMKARFLAQENVYIKRVRKQRDLSIDLMEYIHHIDIESRQISISTILKNGMGIRMNEFLPAFFDCSVDKLPLHHVHRAAVEIMEPKTATETVDF